MLRKSFILVVAALLAAGSALAAEITLLNVSYDPTRELYEEVNRALVTVPAEVVIAIVPVTVTLNVQSVPGDTAVQDNPVTVAVPAATVMVPVPSCHATCAPVGSVPVASAALGWVRLFRT